MKKNYFIVLAAFMFLLNMNITRAQEKKACGIYIEDQKAINEDPSILIRRAQLERFTKEFIKNKDRNTKTTYVIPVVFHVVHDWGPEYISKETIEASIEQMNKDYSATNSDINSVIYQFVNIIGVGNIEFRLAKIDEDGNCTEGITRTRSSYTYNATNAVKTAVPGWDPTMYLNIWTVHDIESGAAAWSHYPGVAGYLDGIVSRYEYIGTTGGGKHTMSHEAGHWMNVAHPWGSSNEPDLASNCNIDDGVEDTPNTKGSPTGECKLDQYTCESLDNVQNIMDYSSCDNMFTIGQVDRMHAALNSSIGGREELWTAANLIATGTNADYAGDPCSPIAEIMLDEETICQERTVIFTDISWNSEVTDRAWTFEGGDPATSNEESVEVMFNSPGTFDVTLSVSNDYGSDEITKNEALVVIGTYSGYQVPAVEGFEDEGFPVNTTEASKSWVLENEGSSNWQYTNTASFSGNGSVRLNNDSNADGVVNSMISPNFNVRGYVLDTISFHLAFARKTEASDGKLIVYLSKDCGQSWKKRYDESGSFLTTNGGVVVSGEFIPTLDEWRQDTLIINGMEDAEHLMIKFENTSLGGNYIYIDNLGFSEITGIKNITSNAALSELNIYPNPVKNTATISFNLVKPERLNIGVYNIIGKLLANINENYKHGKNEISLDNFITNLSNGVYFVKITSSGDVISKRFVKH